MHYEALTYKILLSIKVDMGNPYTRRSDGGLAMLDQKSCYAIAYARNNTPKEKIFGIDIESQKHYIFSKER